MKHVSSSATLFLKYAFPVVCAVFFGSMTLAFWFTDNVNAVADVPILTFRLILTGTFLTLMLLLYFTVMKIKRVEMDSHFMYVTNYFKNVRYPYHQIESIEKRNYFIFKTIRVHLKQAASFGKTITFVSSRNRLTNFLKEHPEVSQQLNLK